MNYFSPYLIVESAALGIINGSFIVFVILFLSSLFIGRFWCGWLCPAAGLQEAAFIAVDKRAAVGKYNLIKYIIPNHMFPLMSRSGLSYIISFLGVYLF